MMLSMALWSHACLCVNIGPMANRITRSEVLLQQTLSSRFIYLVGSTPLNRLHDTLQLLC
jgi:hypothetical protein